MEDGRKQHYHFVGKREEAKLLKPIDEYVEEIQEKIDALRVEGFDKVSRS